MDKTKKGQVPNSEQRSHPPAVQNSLQHRNTHTYTHTHTQNNAGRVAKVKPIRGHARTISQGTKYTHRENGVCIANSLHQRTHICAYRHEGKDDANDSATERGQLAEETLIAVITSTRVCTKLLHRTQNKTCNATQRRQRSIMRVKSEGRIWERDER